MTVMSPYVIKNTRNSTVATINPVQTTGTTFPIELAGAGFPTYGKFMDQNLYWTVENFAKSTAPSAPIEGMNWYNVTSKTFHLWDTVSWKQILTSNTSTNCAFPMQAAAATLNLASAGTTVIMSAAGTGLTYYPTALMLFPVSVVGTFADPCTLNLHTTASEDIMEYVVMGTPNASGYAHYTITGMGLSVSGSQTIKLEVASPYTGTGITATYRAVIFGHIL